MIRVTMTTDQDRVRSVVVEDFEDWPAAIAFIFAVARDDADLVKRVGFVPWDSRSFAVAEVDQ